MKKGRKKANIQKKEKSRQFEYNLRVEKESKKKHAATGTKKDNLFNFIRLFVLYPFANRLSLFAITKHVHVFL